MPYHLERYKNGWRVMDDKGKAYSNKRLSLAKAKQQMKALYANTDLEGAGFIGDLFAKVKQTANSYLKKLLIPTPSRPVVPIAAMNDGDIPPTTVLQQMEKVVYDGGAVSGWNILKQTPTLAFFNQGNIIVVAIRGTYDKRDIKADLAIPIGTLNETERYKDDLNVLLEFRKANPNYKYYGVAHSLGSAIMDLFIDQGLIEKGVSFNGAVEPRFYNIKNANRRIYLDSDPLYHLMGHRTVGHEVRPTQENILHKLPGVGNILKSVLAHSIDNFVGGNVEDMKEDVVTMPKSDYLEEHKALIDLLNRSAKDLLEEANKQSAEVKTKFGGGPMSSGIRHISRGMKGQLAPLAAKVAENIITNRGNPIGLISDLTATASGGAMEENIDFDKVKWGSLTRQFKAYKAKHPEIKTLEDFAKYVKMNQKSFHKTTQQRANFYLNFIERPSYQRTGGRAIKPSKEQLQEEHDRLLREATEPRMDANAVPFAVEPVAPPRLGLRVRPPPPIQTNLPMVNPPQAPMAPRGFNNPNIGRRLDFNGGSKKPLTMADLLKEYEGKFVSEPKKAPIVPERPSNPIRVPAQGLFSKPDEKSPKKGKGTPIDANDEHLYGSSRASGFVKKMIVSGRFDISKVKNPSYDLQHKVPFRQKYVGLKNGKYVTRKEAKDEYIKRVEARKNKTIKDIKYYEENWKYIPKKGRDILFNNIQDFNLEVPKKMKIAYNNWLKRREELIKKNEERRKNEEAQKEPEEIKKPPQMPTPVNYGRRGRGLSQSKAKVVPVAPKEIVPNELDVYENMMKLGLHKYATPRILADYEKLLETYKAKHGKEWTEPARSLKIREEWQGNGLGDAGYLKKVKAYAKKHGYDPKAVSMADDGKHKLVYKTPDGRSVLFGAKNNKDFILYQESEPAVAHKKRAAYLARSAKIRGDWAADKYSANSLARAILWDA
jgi:hypothetical protein